MSFGTACSAASPISATREKFFQASATISEAIAGDGSPSQER